MILTPDLLHPTGMARLTCAVLSLVAAFALTGRAADAPVSDEVALRQMNDDYIKAFLSCDVARFKTLLADDFTGVLATGRVIDKAEFLREAREKPDAKDLRLHEVVIRVYGDSALVGGFVAYSRSTGAPVTTRYTTLYLRRAGAWVVVWVQWTRVAGA